MMLDSNTKIVFIGTGKMGRAIIKGIVTQHILPNPGKQVLAIDIAEKAREEIKKDFGIETASNAEGLQFTDKHILFLCAKPHQIQNILSSVKTQFHPQTLVVSIAAGVRIEQLQYWTSEENPIIRLMPNTALEIAQSMTFLGRGKRASDTHVAIIKNIFSKLGTCEELDEKLFDAATALCGSGPAYFYLVMEALSDAGVTVGLPRALMNKVIAQTMLGSAQMVMQTERHPTLLREDVTTPGGCTAAGVQALEQGALRALFIQAIAAATKKASSLS